VNLSLAEHANPFAKHDNGSFGDLGHLAADQLTVEEPAICAAHVWKIIFLKRCRPNKPQEVCSESYLGLRSSDSLCPGCQMTGFLKTDTRRDSTRDRNQNGNREFKPRTTRNTQKLERRRMFTRRGERGKKNKNRISELFCRGLLFWQCCKIQPENI